MPQAAKDLIEWFKSKAPAQYRVTYMGGTPARWGTLSRDSREAIRPGPRCMRPWMWSSRGTWGATELSKR